MLCFDKGLFVEAVPQDSECIICKEICNDPVQCKCGTIYGRACITKWVERNSTCPHCRSPLFVETLYTNLFCRKMIETKKLRCALSNQGCTWVGEPSQFFSHMQSCDFQEIRCTNASCDQSMERRALADHLEVCPLGLTLCVCGEETKRGETEMHKLVCRCRVQKCPNAGCEEMTTIGTLLSHRNICMFEMVECPLAETGCGRGCLGRVMRSEIEEHVSNPVNMAVSLGRLVALTRELQTANLQQAGTIQRQSASIIRMETSISTLRTRTTQLEGEVVRLSAKACPTNVVNGEVLTVTGLSDSWCNGSYHQTTDACGGWPTYRSQEDYELWMEYSTSLSEWQIKKHSARGFDGCSFYMKCSPTTRPENAVQNWFNNSTDKLEQNGRVQLREFEDDSGSEEGGGAGRRPCRHWARGLLGGRGCRFGNSCKFAHG